MRSRYLAREKRCGVLIDAATLTGTTGFTARHHGGVMSNDAELEQVRNTPLFSTFSYVCPERNVKTIIFPRQARDRRTEEMLPLKQLGPAGWLAGWACN
jgi:hypothetical protein|eukprot:COSAG06_NODE_4280_length_4405_cov_9.242685_4_plen_99_part_00